jgi:hypothetical protein
MGAAVVAMATLVGGVESWKVLNPMGMVLASCPAGSPASKSSTTGNVAAWAGKPGAISRRLTSRLTNNVINTNHDRRDDIVNSLGHELPDRLINYRSESAKAGADGGPCRSARKPGCG